MLQRYDKTKTKSNHAYANSIVVCVLSARGNSCYSVQEKQVVLKRKGWSIFPIFSILKAKGSRWVSQILHDNKYFYCTLVEILITV